MQAGTSFLGSTVGQTGAHQIGQAAGSLTTFQHRALHTGLGGISGALLSPGDMARGAASGALGAFIAESVAEAAAPAHSERLVPDYERGLQRVARLGEVVAAASALPLRLDVAAAPRASRTRTAIEQRVEEEQGAALTDIIETELRDLNRREGWHHSDET